MEISFKPIAEAGVALRSQYQSLLRMADEAHERRLNALTMIQGRFQGGELSGDVAVASAADFERERVRVEAAKCIAGQVGKVSTEALREAVYPESLKLVLQRAGANFEVFMMIGEGQDELREVVAARQQRLTHLEHRLSTSRLAVKDLLLRKLQRAESALLPFEQKTLWTREDTIRYMAAYRALWEEAVPDVQQALGLSTDGV